MAVETEYCDWVLRTCMKPEAWAAWAQAVFSVVAIAVAFYVAHRDSRQRRLDATAVELAQRRTIRFALHRAAALTESLLVHSTSAATMKKMLAQTPLSAFEDAHDALSSVPIDRLRNADEVEAYFDARAAFIEVKARVVLFQSAFLEERGYSAMSEGRAEILRAKIASAAEMLM